MLKHCVCNDTKCHHLVELWLQNCPLWGYVVNIVLPISQYNPKSLARGHSKYTELLVLMSKYVQNHDFYRFINNWLGSKGSSVTYEPHQESDNTQCILSISVSLCYQSQITPTTDKRAAFYKYLLR